MTFRYMQDEPRPLRTESPSTDRVLWSAVFVAFVAGDAVTTSVGLRFAGVVESHPVSASVLLSAGVLGMVAAKVFVTAVAALLYTQADDRYRTAIPLSLAVFGVLIVVVNVAVILTVVL